MKMRKRASSIAVLITFLAAVVLKTEGLQCYECVSGNAAQGDPIYNDKCEGGDLPSSILQTCDNNNAVDPSTRSAYNTSEAARLEKQSVPFACLKLSGHVRGEKATARFCTYGFADEEDRCQDSMFQPVTGTQCICHKDKCNGSVSYILRSQLQLSLFAIAALHAFIRVGQ